MEKTKFFNNYSMDISEEKINSMVTKGLKFISTMDTQTLLVGSILLGGIALVVSSINENILDATTVIMTLVLGLVIYSYLKNRYTREITQLKLKNKLLKQDSILDEVCSNIKDIRGGQKELCSKYKEAKANFYTISNMLLQKYKE